ncbi:oxidoreductase [Gaertneriomyces semiglobifer]|nr:oxidoreductase [Gaertneriomyces semiglobifer]
MLWRKADSHPFDPAGKHVYITGGSQGTGLALAKLLASLGAHVTIVARSVDKLQNAQQEIRDHARTDEQVVHYESADLSDYDNARNALKAAETFVGKKPNASPSLPGAARPMLFSESAPSDISHEMQTDYFTAAYTAHAVVQSFITRPDSQACRLVFVSSLAGLMGLVGYASYSAAKFAVRGLAESLRMELLAHGVRVHIYFPGTIYTPGYEEENKLKPDITKKIEESDEGVTAETAAKILVRGVKKGQYAIVCDLQGDIVRSASKGAAPSNHSLLDVLYATIGAFALPLWRRGADALVYKTRTNITA